MQTLEEPFQGLTPVHEKMPAIHNLCRQGGSQRPATGIFRRAITGDHLDTGMGMQPRGQGVGRAIGEQINRTTTFQIDQEGTIGPPFA